MKCYYVVFGWDFLFILFYFIYLFCWKWVGNWITIKERPWDLGLKDFNSFKHANLNKKKKREKKGAFLDHIMSIVNKIFTLA